MVYPLGILFGDQENPFWQEQILWYRKFLPEYPFQAEFFFADPPRDAEAQAGLCKRLLNSGLSGLIVNPLNGSALAKSAADVKTECLLFDVGPKCSSALAGGIANYVPLPVCDFHEQGLLCAKALLQKTGRSRKPLACVGGPSAARQGRMRVEGAVAAAAAMNVPCLPALWSDFTREGGYEAMKQLLPMDPRAVFCANDLMALGALDLLKEKNAALPVGGVDLIPSAVFSIKKGGLTATVGPRGEDVVRGVLNSVRDFFQEGKRPSGYLARNTLITADALEKKDVRTGTL